MKFLLLLVLGLFSCTHNYNTKVFNDYNVAETQDDPVYHSVAHVIVLDKEKNIRSGGTAFAIQNVNNNTYFVSVHHLCLMRGKDVKLLPLPGKENLRRPFDGRVVYTSEQDDMCIIRAYDTGVQFVAMKFAQSNPLPGDKVFTIGAPSGAFPTKTDGYVVGHDLLGMVPDVTDYKQKLVTSVPVFQGNSGGPVYNESFEVVGMLSASHRTYSHSSLAIHYESILKHLEVYFKKDFI